MKPKVSIMANYPGFFLTLEGNDGAGKSTLRDALASYVSKTYGSLQGVVHTREPGGSDISEKLREILLDKNSGSIANESELCLFFAARREHYDRTILPALKQGALVICDRFTDTSVAYQGGGRQLGTDAVLAMNQFVMKGVKPDLTIYLEVDYETSIKRRGERAVTDRFEEEDEAFFKRVNEGFDEAIESDPDRFLIIDATGDFESVLQKATHAVDVAITTIRARQAYAQMPNCDNALNDPDRNNAG